MACFVVSAAAGVGVAIARHAVKHSEKKKANAGIAPKIEKFGSDTKWSKKLAYLELMLFAGSFILAIEHIIHGEIVPFPPFFTAISEGGTIDMLKEMGTIGVAMLGILVAVWGIGVLVSDYIKFKRRKALPEAKKEGAK